MKTLNDLTPEIRSKIQEYKDHCVKDLYSGKEHQEWKIEHFDNCGCGLSILQKY